jgi:hypothetical protein
MNRVAECPAMHVVEMNFLNSSTTGRVLLVGPQHGDTEVLVLSELLGQTQQEKFLGGRIVHHVHLWDNFATKVPLRLRLRLIG